MKKLVNMGTVTCEKTMNHYGETDEIIVEVPLDILPVRGLIELAEVWNRKTAKCKIDWNNFCIRVQSTMKKSAPKGLKNEGVELTTVYKGQPYEDDFLKYAMKELCAGAANQKIPPEKTIEHYYRVAGFSEKEVEEISMLGTAFQWVDGEYDWLDGDWVGENDWYYYEDYEWYCYLNY